jgi:hypothetical protein
MSSANFPDSRFRLEARQYLLQQDYAGNRSLLRNELWVIKQGSSTRYNTDPTSNWSTNVNGWVNGASFGYDFRNSGQLLLDMRDAWIGHDGNGYGGWGTSGYANLADIGSASVSDNGSFPRIPKRPQQPYYPSFTNITTTDVRVTSSVPDNMGAGIDAYLFQVDDDPGFGSPSSIQNNSGNVQDFTGLTPGVTYYARTQAHNSQGWSDWSPTGSVATLPALYVSDGANWIPSSMQVSDGTSWAGAQLLYSDGSSWLNPLPQ